MYYRVHPYKIAIQKLHNWIVEDQLLVNLRPYSKPLPSLPSYPPGWVSFAGAFPRWAARDLSSQTIGGAVEVVPSWFHALESIPVSPTKVCTSYLHLRPEPLPLQVIIVRAIP